MRHRHIKCAFGQCKMKLKYCISIVAATAAAATTVADKQEIISSILFEGISTCIKRMQPFPQLAQRRTSTSNICSISQCVQYIEKSSQQKLKSRIVVKIIWMRKERERKALISGKKQKSH